MALFRVLCWALIFILRNRLVLFLVLYVNWGDALLILTSILTQILTLILMVDVLPMVTF